MGPPLWSANLVKIGLQLPRDIPPQKKKKNQGVQKQKASSVDLSSLHTHAQTSAHKYTHVFGQHLLKKAKDTTDKKKFFLDCHVQSVHASLGS